MTARLGVLGGTFDPVHVGHLDAADAARSAMALTDVLFVPSYDPPHRSVDPRATGFHRFAMLALATTSCPSYRLSDMELVRGGHSYTSDTLRTLHTDGWQPWQIFFIIGTDAFAEIAAWHEFPSVLDLAHFMVVARPGTPFDPAMTRSPELKTRMRSASTYAGDAGPTGLFVIEADTRDVSSTLIRQRLRARQPIDDLVPSAVGRYIETHHLYEVEDELHGSNTNQHRT